MTAQPPEHRDPDNERVSRNVRAELARRQISQAEIASLIGRERTWIADRLNSRADWRIIDVTAVARALGVHADVLLSGLAPVPTTTED